MAAGQFGTALIYPTLTVWDSASKNAGVTLSNANLTAAISTASFGAFRAIKGSPTDGTTQGRIYWEVKFDSGVIGVGLCNTSFSFSSGNWVGIDTNSIGYFNGGSFWSAGSGSSTLTLASYVAGDTVNCALDVSAAKFYVGKNGTWQNSGNPDAGTGAVVTGLTGTWYPAASNGGAGSAGQMTATFGETAFANSPANITKFFRGVPYQ